MVVLPQTTHPVAVAGPVALTVTAKAVLVRADGADAVVSWGAIAVLPPVDPCDLVLLDGADWLRLDRPSDATALALDTTAGACVVYVVELAA